MRRRRTVRKRTRQRLRTHRRRLAGSGSASFVAKNTVGLEMPCPAGAYHCAPEIPNAKKIAGAMPRKCELAHNRGSFFQQGRGLRVRTNKAAGARRRVFLLSLRAAF
jgi:hypothetical protein